MTQGSLGDCWLAASMAAVARARPEVIRSMIRARGDGRYDVSLYIDEDGVLIVAPDEPRVVTVTSSFPMLAGAPAYARPGDTSATGETELWPMLIEKAYAAAISGGYPSLQGEVMGVGRVGGFAGLLGTGARPTQVTPGSEPEILADIGGALAAGRPVICETPAEFDSAQARAARGVGVRSNHAYAPISVDGDTIHLQDPNHHRDISVPAATFSQVFASYSLAGDATPRDAAVGGAVETERD